jgi:SAM-dependent methyltransferase
MSASEWDGLYETHKPEELPWYGIPFPEEVTGYLDSLDKDKTVLVTGCGAGDAAHRLKGLGLRRVIGTDISGVAIERARKRFPGIEFRAVATEDLEMEGYRNVNVLDWLNLHQIDPGSLEGYLGSLVSICSSIMITYIYEIEKGESRPSYVRYGRGVHNHPPERVSKILGSLRKVKEFGFSFDTNPGFGPVHHHDAVGLVFSR